MAAAPECNPFQEPFMKMTWLVAMAAMLAAGLVACGGGETVPEHAAQAGPTEGVQALTETDAALRIAQAGHGQWFDAKMQRLDTGLKSIEAVQLAVRNAALKATGGQFDDATLSFMKQADELVGRGDLSETDRLSLQGAVAWKMLTAAGEKLTAQYEWRLESANQHIQDVFKPGTFQIRPDILELLHRVGYLDILNRWPQFWGYAKRCDSNGVPVPPDFALSGTAWVHRGPLHNNILDGSGATADVWSWSDPTKRGVCIALPRGSGLAGIICQSASTGAACFWDNIDAASGARVDWRTQTLRINELKNGSNLSENCTGCHRGNNVFLISPDDSTWAKLLRPLAGTVGATLTTRVETSTDNRGGRPRYFPVTTFSGRAGWENVFNSSASCASCHEAPPASVTGLTSPPPMPPACAALPGGCGS
jgi:hypothetical protein